VLSTITLTLINYCLASIGKHSLYIHNQNQSINDEGKNVTLGEKFRFLQRVRVMVLNTTFNNISVISWQSVLLVEETGVPGENH
jgi:hypothetical protein